MTEVKADNLSKVKYIKSENFVTEFIDQINVANMVGSDGTAKVTVIFGRDVAEIHAETVIFPANGQPAHSRVMEEDVEQYRLILANLSMPLIVAERLANGLAASIESIKAQLTQE